MTQKKIVIGSNIIQSMSKKFMTGTSSVHEKSKTILPRNVGEVFDFRDFTDPVWVGGRPYNTVKNGNSTSINVQGQVIVISSVSEGNLSTFAKIKFEII